MVSIRSLHVICVFKAVTEHMLAKVTARKGKGELRLDRISDGTKAAGFAWTYTCMDLEGLRGTTYIELNDKGEIGGFDIEVFM